MMQPKLGIIAGGGLLPAVLMDNCEREGRDYVVVALKGQAAPEVVTGKPHKWIRIGAAGKILAYLAANNVQELALAGSIQKPAAKELRPDLWMAKFLAGNIYELGDNGLFRQLINHLEGEEGFSVIGIENLAPELITPIACMTNKLPSAADLNDIKYGLIEARKLGKQDVGQGVIVAEGVVLSQEDRMGTDAMIKSLPRLGSNKKRRGILVKALKPGQERRVDLPTVGPDTVDLAADFGLRGIALEAEHTLILDRERLVKNANQRGVFVIGIDGSTANDRSLSWPLIYLIAGEPSADNLGAGLIKSLKKLTNNEIRFSGIGGPAMIAENFESLFPMEDLSVMGLTEVVPKIALLRSRILETKNDVLKKSPDVLLGIDSPDFNFRVAEKLAAKNIPLVHFVAPSVWAWRPKRAEKIAKFLDHLFTLLPFEPPYFEKYGLPTTYVGHPVLESGIDTGDGLAFRQRYKIRNNEQILLLLFGSRRAEVLRHIEEFKETVLQLSKTIKNLRVVTIAVNQTKELVSQAVNHWPIQVITSSDPREKPDIFAASNVALAASGTVALELALAMVPSVIAYRMNPVTSWFAKRLVKIRFANLVNLILEREVVPEFLLDQCRAELIAPTLKTLMTSPKLLQQQRDDYHKAIALLGNGDHSASERAAKTLLKIIKSSKKHRHKNHPI